MDNKAKLLLDKALNVNDKYEKLSYLKEGYDMGDLDCIYQLGLFLYYEDNQKELALDILKKASEKGHTDAMYDLGIILMGMGYSAENCYMRDGFLWICKSAKWCNTKAFAFIEFCIDFTAGARNSFWNSFDYLIYEAIRINDARANLFMGLCHYYGIFYEKRTDLALNYIVVAARMGSKQAKNILKGNWCDGMRHIGNVLRGYNEPEDTKTVWERKLSEMINEMDKDFLAELTK